MAPGILAVAEVADGALTRLSAEVATLARSLAGTAGTEALGLVVDVAPDAPASELARFVPRVIAVKSSAVAQQPAPAQVAAEVVRLLGEGVTHVVVGVSTDGRDIAGILVGLVGIGLLANADEVSWTDGAPVARSAVLGGKAVATSTVTASSGIVSLRPGGITAQPGATAGRVETREPATSSLPVPVVLDRVSEAGAEVALEDARVVVVGGRGVGGAEGFGLVEELAGVLGGVVGATRVPVDAGWVPYSRQIGQTGRVVRPALYVGLGVSGEMQHRVGMQASEAIVAVNRDRDAPIAEIADMFVVGDLFEVAPGEAAEIRARRGG